jgi:hypothetical protein
MTLDTLTSVLNQGGQHLGDLARWMLARGAYREATLEKIWSGAQLTLEFRNRPRRACRTPTARADPATCRRRPRQRPPAVVGWAVTHELSRAALERIVADPVLARRPNKARAR